MTAVLEVTALCKRMSAVISSIDLNLSSESAIYVVSANTRAVMFEVVTGHRPPDNLLAPLLLNVGSNSDPQLICMYLSLLKKMLHVKTHQFIKCIKK